MALRKQIIKDVSSESQQTDDDTQEDEAAADRDDKDELSTSLLSVRDKRRREKENKSKPKEMTEEEMMDMALRLSEREASVTALRLREEEEAVMKAIQESMVDHTQPCPTSTSQTLLSNADASLRLLPRRKLTYSNGKRTSAVDQGCTPETQLSPAAKGTGEESTSRNKKRKRRAGSPLLEMPDLSQTQNLCSQVPPPSPERVSINLDSPQSSDSTQIDDCQLRLSPVFPLTGCRVEVHVDRMSQNQLDSCRNSGFVFCSQDSRISTQYSAARPESPTFPQSNLPLCPKSPVSSEADRGDSGETERSPEYVRSPVFGRNTQHERSPSACRAQLSVCSPTCQNSGFTSSQESLIPSVRSNSPVFPRSPGLPNILHPSDRSAFPKIAERRRTEQSRSVSPTEIPAAAELRGSDGGGSPSGGNQDSRADGCPDTITLSSQSEELTERSETELTSDMKLVWSDEDEDVTPAGSPSPVFPEERSVRRAENQPASLNHTTAAPPGTTGPDCSPDPLRCVSAMFEDQSSADASLRVASSSSTSAGRQQIFTTDEERRPVTRQGAVSRVVPQGGDAAGGQTVHYYWGVPFCPRGLDPDSYTQVILAQMEVYEKSLKQAQRCLLRKAEWGEAVLPQPEKSPSPEPPAAAESPPHLVPRRRGLGLRGKKCDSADAPPAEAEDDDEEQRRKTESVEEEDKKEEEEERMETDDCDVCPETQLSDNDSTQDLTMDTDTAAEPPPESPELTEVKMILRDDSPVRDEPSEEEEVEVVGDETETLLLDQTAGNASVSGGDAATVRADEVKEDRMGPDPDVEEVQSFNGLQRSVSPEPAVVPRSPQTAVDCPICQASFPAREIEMHAAYCDGDVAVVGERRPRGDCYQVALKPRRKRTRRAEVAAEDGNDSSIGSRSQEKCYVCQKAVPLRDYSRHTELCIQRQPSKSAAKGSLLLALEQTERRDSDAGPSGSKLQSGDVIDLQEDEDEVSAFRLSNSPIRSFTPISEAAGCLIDFKKQQRAKKPSRGRR